MDGFVADAEFLRDFLVNQSPAQEVEHLLFALGKAFARLFGGRAFLKRLHDLARDVHGHRRPAPMEFLNGFEQFLAGGALEHVTARARRQRVEDVFRVLINREHHHLDLRRQLLQLPHAFDSVHAGQIDVHEHHVGFDVGQILERVLGAGMLAHATEAVGAVQHARQRAAQLVIVFNDGNRNGHG